MKTTTLAGHAVVYGAILAVALAVGSGIAALVKHPDSCSRGETKMNDPKIACTLDARELQERQKGLHARLAAAVLERRELANGYAFRFAPGSAIFADLTRFIDEERQCCAFLRFSLVQEPASGPLWLELSGSGMSKDIIKLMLDAALQAD